MAVNDNLDLVNGTEFFDMESNRQMLIKNWRGQPWLFYKHPDGDWIPACAATDEDMELLHAAHEEAMTRSRVLADLNGYQS